MEYLLKTSAAIVLFYICYKLFLQRETFFQHNRWFLLSGLIIALCIPFVVIPIYIEYTPTPIQDFTVINQVSGETVFIEEPFSWVQLLPWIYISGVIFFFGRLLIDLFSLASLMYRNKSYKKDKHTFIEVEEIVAPFSFFNNIVYNPKQFDNKELELIINHEKVHAKQYHSIDILLIHLATIFFWFNPLIWLYKKELQQNLEYIADDKAQSIAECKKSYQHILLKASVPNHQLSLTNNFYNSLIKKRIVMLHKNKSKHRSLWKFALILPFLSIFLMSFNTKEIFVAVESDIETKKDKAIEFVVTKNTTDDELDLMIEEVESKGGTLEFKNLKRNTKNEITNIFVSLYKHSYGGGNSKEPIESFIIYKNLFGDGEGFIGKPNGSTMFFDKKQKNLRKANRFSKKMKKHIEKNGLLKDIKIIITKDFTDEDLEKAKAEALKEGVTLNFSDIKRNDKGEIIEIFAEFDGKEVGSGKYYLSSDIPIQSFAFTYSKNSTGFGMINQNSVVLSQYSNQNKTNKTNIFVTESDDKEQTQNSIIVYLNADNKFIVSGADENKVLYLLDNDEVTRADLDALDFDKIKTYETLTAEKAIEIYGEKGKNGVIILKTKAKNPWSFGIPKVNSQNYTAIVVDSVSVINGVKSKNGVYYENNNNNPKIVTGSYLISKPKTLNNNSLFYFDDDNKEKPLFIIDNKIIEENGFKKLNPNNIASMNIIKGKDAINLYGEKGKNGVIIILTQKPKNLVLQSNKNDSPWEIGSEVSIVSYYDDKDASKNANLAFISKYSTDKVLKQHKADLESLGLTVKYSKTKRNKAGELIRIKITLSDEGGRKSSATFKDDDGIVNIQYGISESNLVVRSSKI